MRVCVTGEEVRHHCTDRKSSPSVPQPDRRRAYTDRSLECQRLVAGQRLVVPFVCGAPMADPSVVCRGGHVVEAVTHWCPNILGLIALRNAVWAHRDSWQDYLRVLVVDEDSLQRCRDSAHRHAAAQHAAVVGPSLIRYGRFVGLALAPLQVRPCATYRRAGCGSG